MNRKEAKPGSWLAEAKPGRVFELSRKTYAGANVRALVIRDPTGPDACAWRGDFLREVDERGCVPDGQRGRARRSVRVIRTDEFKAGMVIARRPELERFDCDDLAMIRYGIGVSFGGRLDRSSHGATCVPMLPGIRWTALWTAYDMMSMPSSEERRALDRALSGAWHFRVFGNPTARWSEEPDFGRCDGYVTAARDPSKIAAIAKALSVRGTVHRATFETTARDEGDRYVIRATGGLNPLVRLSGSHSRSKVDGSWGMSSH